MKLTGELKLVYKTTLAEVDQDPEEIGRFLLDNAKQDAGMIKHHFRSHAGAIIKEGFSVVKRDPRSPGICPINTVIEARISYFEKECTCGEGADKVQSVHAVSCRDFGIAAWGRERARRAA